MDNGCKPCGALPDRDYGAVLEQQLASSLLRLKKSVNKRYDADIEQKEALEGVKLARLRLAARCPEVSDGE